jgi:hypothetical protein
MIDTCLRWTLFLAIAAPAGAAGKSAGDLPSADEILDRYVLALVGKEALEKRNP